MNLFFGKNISTAEQEKQKLKKEISNLKKKLADLEKKVIIKRI